MSYQVLALKWRPRSFASMVGQEHVLQALVNALDNDRLHHAYLFTGTRGVGKTTVARIFAKSLNCEKGITSIPCGVCSACCEIDEGRFLDLIEVDAASRPKVEDTRELLENVQYAPTRGRFKVYLIDEVHMLSSHSFNALLKTLEEPPPHVKFLLATTDPQKLPVTVLSRCLQFNLKRMSPEMIAGHLRHVLQEEGVAADGSAITLISVAADGSMRDALSLLDQAIAYGGGAVKEAEVRAMLGTVDRSHVYKILQALADEDAEALLVAANEQALLGVDFSSVLDELISLLHKLALAQVAPQAVADSVDAEWVKALAAAISPEDVQLFYQIALNGRQDLPYVPEPRAGFEMILLRMLAFRPVDLSHLDPSASTPVSAPPQTDRSVPAAASSPLSRPEPPSSKAAASSGIASAKAALNSAKAALDGGKSRGVAAAPLPTSAPVSSASASVTPQSVQPSGAAMAAEISPPMVQESVPPAMPESTPGPGVSDASAAGSMALNSAEDWRWVVERLGLQGMAYQLAINSVMTRREGDTLHLTLAAQHNTLRISTTEKRLQESLQQALGQRVVLRYTVTAATAGQETPAAIQQREARDRQTAALRAMHADPLVQQICKTFNGRVVDDSVQSI